MGMLKTLAVGVVAAAALAGSAPAASADWREAAALAELAAGCPDEELTVALAR